jgi:hypothetical protein
VTQPIKPARARTCVANTMLILLRVSCAAIAWLACSASARAETPSAVVFAPPDSGHKSDAKVVREVRAALEKNELATVLAQPPLDLDAMQLTIDCVGESAECLGKVAERSKARILIVPSIMRAKGGSTLRVLYFDASAHDTPHIAEHHAHGGDVDKETLAAIPDMLRELFASPKPEPKPVVDETAAVEPTEDDATPAPPAATQPAPADDKPRKPLPLGPLLLGGGGVAALTAGLVVGAMMKHTQNHYADRNVQTAMQAKQADDESKRGKQQALVADVLIGVGATALLAGAIWFAAGMVDERAPAQTALVPVIGTHGAMLSLTGVWEDRP